MALEYVSALCPKSVHSYNSCVKMEKKKKDFEWILSYLNILHKTVGMFNLKTEFQEKKPEEKAILICIHSAQSPKLYYKLKYKSLVLRSQRSQVTEQLQNPKIKECLVPLVHGVLISNTPLSTQQIILFCRHSKGNKRGCLNIVID